MPVAKMLGGLGAPMSTPVPMKVPTGPLKLDSGSGWQVGGPEKFGSTMGSRNHGNSDLTPVQSKPATPAGPNTFNGGLENKKPASAMDTASPNPLPPPSGPPPTETGPMSLNSGAAAKALPEEDLPGAVRDDDDGA